MMNFLRARLGTKLVPITIILMLVLFASCSVMAKLYLNQVSENAVLNQKLLANQEAYVALQQKLDSERAATESIRKADEVVDRKYVEIDKDVELIETNPSEPALDSDAVADLLCERGLAKPSACATRSAPRLIE